MIFKATYYTEDNPDEIKEAAFYCLVRKKYTVMHKFQDQYPEARILSIYCPSNKDYIIKKEMLKNDIITCILMNGGKLTRERYHRMSVPMLKDRLESYRRRKEKALFEKEQKENREFEQISANYNKNVI